jgi:preprotein translocase subunit SecG
MNWLQTATMILHLFLCVGIVGLVLLQRGKGADAGAGFGAGASGTVFGARGSASFLSRTTAILASLFFVTCLTLAYLGNTQVKNTSVIDSVAGATASAASSAQSSDQGIQIPASVPATPAAGQVVPVPVTEPASK